MQVRRKVAYINKDEGVGSFDLSESVGKCLPNLFT